MLVPSFYLGSYKLDQHPLHGLVPPFIQTIGLLIIGDTLVNEYLTKKTTVQFTCGWYGVIKCRLTPSNDMISSSSLFLNSFLWSVVSRLGRPIRMKTYVCSNCQ